MTSRNQRRNRKLATARETIKHLEGVVRALRERLAEIEPDEVGPGYCSPEELRALQDEYNRRTSKYLEKIAANPRAAP